MIGNIRRSAEKPLIGERRTFLRPIWEHQHAAAALEEIDQRIVEGRRDRDLLILRTIRSGDAGEKLGGERRVQPEIRRRDRPRLRHDPNWPAVFVGFGRGFKARDDFQVPRFVGRGERQIERREFFQRAGILFDSFFRDALQFLGLLSRLDQRRR